MSVHGIEFEIGFAKEVTEVEDRVDKLVECLAENFAMVSIDVALDTDKGRISVLLGVETSNQITSDQEQLAAELAGDAVERALVVSGFAPPSNRESSLRPSSRVSEFA